jgi:hypothetical protein
MKITHIEPTPSPNVMKLTMDEHLNAGVRLNYTKATKDQAPIYIRKLLEINHVVGVFQTANFIAIERHPKGDWQSILADTQLHLPVAQAYIPQAMIRPIDAVDDHFGEVTVRVQTFRGIPMQVRVSAGLEERRENLPERFIQAAMEAGLHAPNLIMERKLEERGIRYGELDDVLHEIISELTASIDEKRLQAMVQNMQEEQGIIELNRTIFQESDWQKRFSFLERLPLQKETFPLLVQAMQDPHLSIRRLAIAQMGMLEDVDVMPYIIQALSDPSPIIRRTAGDVCSDKGDMSAMSKMVELLHDVNKLVRWRAARYLYELGGQEQLEALQLAEEDPEFEIRLQIQLAIARIASGQEAEGAVWQQMSKRNH